VVFFFNLPGGAVEERELQVLCRQALLRAVQSPAAPTQFFLPLPSDTPSPLLLHCSNLRCHLDTMAKCKPWIAGRTVSCLQKASFPICSTCPDRDEITDVFSFG